ncbi:MAG: TIGR03960 family B12-binding radical SAM protein [Desulfobulbaceae bacterium]
MFPDLYEIGMSHFGLQILYHILNREKGIAAERCYCPDIDMEQELRRRGLPLFSLESRRPLREFDVIGITLPYELCYTNILTILDLAGVPFRASERGEEDPLVIGGGSCGMNPEPVADFFDAIVLGDGEEPVREIAALVREAKAATASRMEVLARLARIEGVYVPSFFTPRYEKGELVAVEPVRAGYDRVRRRVLPRLPGPGELGAPLVPVVRPVHDRLGIEIARGCTRGCRFCQAGIIYRPVRERSLEEILTIAERDIAATGFEELALLSLSTGDYSCLPELMHELMDRFADRYVSISMPSMRVGTLTGQIMEEIRRVRKTGFTVAPEAGTDRLREVINKGITEADLLETCRNAFELGWNLIKFYFMIGLPTETWEDVEGIVELARKARREAGPGPGRAQINVSVGTFVPKPHTPFQWERQLSVDESRERIERLKKLLPRKGFKLKWHDPEQSCMEGVFSRGDRRLSSLIERAWRNGVRLDGWSEHYRLENWRKAAVETGIDLDSYLQARDPDKPLPWEHLESGVDRDFLLRERTRAFERQYTPDCRDGRCGKCGLCDFKTLRPVVHRPEERGGQPPVSGSGRKPKGSQSDKTFSYRVQYSRRGDSRFFSHLEILQLIFRAVSRAGIEVMHSRGFNPSPKISFSPALSVGTESEVEYFDMDLAAPLSDPSSVIDRLNDQFPPGMRIREITVKPKKEPEAVLVEYVVTLSRPLDEARQRNVASFLAADSFPVEQVRKKKRRSLDIRPLVRDLAEQDGRLVLKLVRREGTAGTNPGEVLRKVVGFSDKEALQARVLKRSVTVFSTSA